MMKLSDFLYRTVQDFTHYEDIKIYKGLFGNGVYEEIFISVEYDVPFPFDLLDKDGNTINEYLRSDITEITFNNGKLCLYITG